MNSFYDIFINLFDGVLFFLIKHTFWLLLLLLLEISLCNAAPFLNFFFFQYLNTQFIALFVNKDLRISSLVLQSRYSQSLSPSQTRTKMWCQYQYLLGHHLLEGSGSIEAISEHQLQPRLLTESLFNWHIPLLFKWIPRE